MTDPKSTKPTGVSSPSGARSTQEEIQKLKAQVRQLQKEWTDSSEQIKNLKQDRLDAADFAKRCVDAIEFEKAQAAGVHAPIPKYTVGEITSAWKIFKSDRKWI